MLLRTTILAVALVIGVSLPAAAALRLAVAPATSLNDESVTIVVTGAAPGSDVAIELRTTLFGTPFGSHAVYRARPDGTVRVDRDAAIAGPYAGVDGMGLFWTVAAAGPHADIPFDVFAARQVTIAATSGTEAASQTITRLAVAADVRRVDVDASGVLGTAFFPSHSRPVPGLVVLGGSEGGKPEEMAALLASHGFATLALAYFNAGTLPKSLTNVPLELVERGVAWLHADPRVNSRPVGILGGSKGAELALLAATKFSDIRAVVAMKPSSVVFTGLFHDGAPASSWSYGGAPLPFVDGPIPAAVDAQIAADSAAKRPVAYAPRYLARIQNATNSAAATIPVERIAGPVMLVSGDDDQLWPSSYMANAILQRLTDAKHPYADRWLHYAQAGHGIDRAFAPAMHSAGNQFLALGGTPAGNAHASADSWPQILTFLRAALH